MTSPLDSVRADDIARYLAERNSRVYSLREVSEMTGFALRDLEIQCREGKIRHTAKGRTRGMTLRQIDLLVECFEVGETDPSLVRKADDLRDAIESSRMSGGRRATRRAA